MQKVSLPGKNKRLERQPGVGGWQWVGPALRWWGLLLKQVALGSRQVSWGTSEGWSNPNHWEAHKAKIIQNEMYSSLGEAGHPAKWPCPSMLSLEGKAMLGTVTMHSFSLEGYSERPVCSQLDAAYSPSRKHTLSSAAEAQASNCELEYHASYKALTGLGSLIPMADESKEFSGSPGCG